MTWQYFGFGCCQASFALFSSCSLLDALLLACLEVLEPMRLRRESIESRFRRENFGFLLPLLRSKGASIGRHAAMMDVEGSIIVHIIAFISKELMSIQWVTKERVESKHIWAARLGVCLMET